MRSSAPCSALPTTCSTSLTDRWPSAMSASTRTPNTGPTPISRSRPRTSCGLTPTSMASPTLTSRIPFVWAGPGMARVARKVPGMNPMATAPSSTSSDIMPWGCMTSISLTPLTKTTILLVKRKPGALALISATETMPPMPASCITNTTPLS